MGIVIRQSIATTLISFFGAVIGYINLLYLYPYFLSPDQVGILRTVQDAAILFAPFAQFGLAQSVYRFHPRFANSRIAEQTFINLLLIFGIVGFSIFFVIYKVFEQPIVSYFQENAKQVIQFSSLILWFTLVLLLSAILEAYSRSLLKTIVPNFLREIVVRLLLAVAVILYFEGWLTYDEFVVSSVLAYLIALLILMAYLALNNQLGFTFTLGSIELSTFRELVRYSMFSFAGTAGMIIVGKIDSIMVAGIIGTSAVAVYTTAFYIATIIEYPKRSLTQVVMPLIARAFAADNITEVEKLYRKTSINQFIIGSILLIGIYINLDNIFSLMPKQDVYAAGYWVVVIVGIAKLIDMAFGPSSEIIVLSKYYGFNMLLVIALAVLVVITNNYLIPEFGIIGAAIGVTIALFAFNFIKYIFILVTFKIQPFDRNTLKLLMIAGATVALNSLIPKLDIVLIDILIRSAIVATFFATAVLWMRISPDANNLVSEILKKAGIKFPRIDK